MDKENIVRTPTSVPRTTRMHVVLVSVLAFDFDFDLEVLDRMEFPVIDFGDDDAGGSDSGDNGEVGADDMVDDCF